MKAIARKINDKEWIAEVEKANPGHGFEDEWYHDTYPISGDTSELKEGLEIEGETFYDLKGQWDQQQWQEENNKAQYLAFHITLPPIHSDPAGEETEGQLWEQFYAIRKKLGELKYPGMNNKINSVASQPLIKDQGEGKLYTQSEFDARFEEWKGMYEATDPRIEEDRIGQEKVWMEYIEKWQPRGTNSGLAQALEDKFAALKSLPPQAGRMFSEGEVIHFYNWFSEQDPRWDSESDMFAIFENTSGPETFYTEKQVVKNFIEYLLKQNPK